MVVSPVVDQLNCDAGQGRDRTLKRCQTEMEIERRAAI